MVLESPIKKKGKKIQKQYYYAVHEIQRGPREGEEEVRLAKGDDWDADVVKSRRTPAQTKENQAMFNEGIIGKPSQGGGFETYAEAVRYGSEGGKASSRRKGKDEAEKQKAKRARAKQKNGELLTAEEQELVSRGNPQDKPAETLTEPTNPRYRYHMDKAATAQERKERWKEKQKKDRGEGETSD